MDVEINKQRKLIKLYEREIAKLNKELESASNSVTTSTNEQQQHLENGENGNTTEINDNDNDASLLGMPRESGVDDNNNNNNTDLLMMELLEKHESNPGSAYLNTLQAYIQGFCFTNVDKIQRSPAIKFEKSTPTATTVTATDEAVGNNNNSSNDDNNNSSNNENAKPLYFTYRMQGYFMARPSLKATFVLLFEVGNSELGCIKHLTCELHENLSSFSTNAAASENNNNIVDNNNSGDKNSTTANNNGIDNWQWLVQQATPTLPQEYNNLPLWLDRLSTYLEFHEQRADFLGKVLELARTTTTTTNQIKVTFQQQKCLIQINAHKKQVNNSDAISLVWVWKWKEEKDALRLTSSKSFLPNKLSQVDIDRLVDQKGSCREALCDLLLSMGIINKLSKSTSTDNNDSLYKSRGVDAIDNNLAASPSFDDVDHDADDEVSGHNLTDIDSMASDERNIRLSPSGRRRSEYEVLRLQKIERNNEKLAELGLTIGSSNNNNNNNNEALKMPAQLTKRKRKSLDMPINENNRKLAPYTKKYNTSK